MVDVKQVADAADMIVNGYAFTRCAEGFRVLNLNRPDRAVVFSNDGKVLETSMDDIEVRIAGDYLEKNRKFMEICSFNFLICSKYSRLRRGCFSLANLRSSG